MKINIHNFGLAGAVTTTIWYGIIALLVKTWPVETLKFIATAHMIPRLENIVPYMKITPAGIFTGISIHFVSAYCFFFLLGLFYNIFNSLGHK